MESKLPKRLIEVDLPIRRISEHALREKCIRHGHISTLHIWWARRPLAACRAVLCASLWPDPADVNCPEYFKKQASQIMLKWAKEYRHLSSLETNRRKEAWLKNPSKANNGLEIRKALLDFIADFSNWDNSTSIEYLETSKYLNNLAFESLGGDSNTSPIVVDPFAGGGAIPLEALRVGADVVASDLNPISVLLNKVILEYIPKYGKKLADEVKLCGNWIKEQAEKDLNIYYPKDQNGDIPIAYLWSRTIQCEGPGCGAELPLIRSLFLAKKGNKSIALKIIINNIKNKPYINFEIVNNISISSVGSGTVKRGSATCPCCGYTTPVASVRKQLKLRNGGADDARLLCVITITKNTSGRNYRIPNILDINAIEKSKIRLSKLSEEIKDISIIPDEILPIMSGVFNVPLYGLDTWGKLFTRRQALTLYILFKYVNDIKSYIGNKYDDKFINAIRNCVALSVSRQTDYSSSLCSWHLTREVVNHTFGRQALPMIWDFTEVAPLSGGSGSYLGAVDWICRVIEENSKISANPGTVYLSSATNNSLPDSSVNLIFTDPPYYNAVPYADLSDYFYVWLKRCIGKSNKDLFKDNMTPKKDECCEMAGWDSVRYPEKDGLWFENKMKSAMLECRRILKKDGIGVVVFAHKSTSGWEAQLQAMIDAGWTVTASWPIDTEMGSRLRAMNSAALASSVHLVCRPRIGNSVGDWRDVLSELPKRIHDWMPRLSEEGVVGADAIFACLGPALEIFSRYNKIEKANGDVVPLREYLEHVWAAVSREALSMIFSRADATGFEEDSRLTAIWFWTLNTGVSSELNQEDLLDDETIDDESITTKSSAKGGYTLDYDTSRKIAQGLGIHLEKLNTILEIKGDKSRLYSVSERVSFLFGKEKSSTMAPKGRKKSKELQLDLFQDTEQTIEQWEKDSKTSSRHGSTAGDTVLDRLHQAMILFSSGRNEALRRFIVDDAAGRDERFWRLAQSLSALYPSGSEEKRWVDGVLSRKKTLGF